MTRSIRLLFALSVLAALVLPAVAPAQVVGINRPKSTNLVPLGTSSEPLPAPTFNTNLNSDIAFWRNYAIQGSYNGFRIIDVSNPAAPVEVSDVICGASQGDITISPDGNILVRSQDSSRALPGNDPNQACVDNGVNAPLSTAWEGLQIFDISNKAAPRFIRSVFLDFGSHTHTQYYDRANNRLIIYVSRGGSREGSGGYSAATPNPYGGQNWPATNGCISAVEVPLANPAGAAVVNRCIVAGQSSVTVTAGGGHDVLVYEGMKRLYGACRPNMILWDISDPVNPRRLHEQEYPGITGWHSAGMSWNGQLLFAGWEPGGGSNPRCQPVGATMTQFDMTGNPTTVNAPVQTAAMKTIFVFRARDGVLVGRWVLPQEQNQFENCTIHNYALAPYVDKHILVGDAYQAGNFVVDFTDSLNGNQVAFSDPPAIDRDPATPGTQANSAGGEWSTHWYNDLIYASDIQEGVNIWDVREPWWETHSVNLGALNPQTMTERLTCRVRTHGALRAKQRRELHIQVRVNRQRIAGMSVNLRGAGLRLSRVTRASGDLMLRVKPSRAGTLRIWAKALNVAPCTTNRRVAAARSGVAGVAAGGGVALTGRPT